jgi:hypothetical protein
MIHIVFLIKRFRDFDSAGCQVGYGLYPAFLQKKQALVGYISRLQRKQDRTGAVPNQRYPSTWPYPFSTEADARAAEELTLTPGLESLVCFKGFNTSKILRASP